MDLEWRHSEDTSRCLKHHLKQVIIWTLDFCLQIKDVWLEKKNKIKKITKIKNI